MRKKRNAGQRRMNKKKGEEKRIETTSYVYYKCLEILYGQTTQYHPMLNHLNMTTTNCYFSITFHY